VLWLDRAGEAAVGGAPSVAEAARRLAGTYDFALVTTEGAGAPKGVRLHLRLVAVDDSARRRCLGGPCRPGAAALVLAGTLGAAGAPFDSVAAARARLRGSDAVEFRYDSARGAARFHTDPGVLHAGTHFDVAEAGPAGFSGRWEYGAPVGFTARRGAVDVFEASRGYYCARRAGPAAAP
jgi:hypothetical protein